MSEAAWWRHLRGDPSRFLLDDEEPGVVWRALLDLLGRPADSPAVHRARTAARESGLAAAMLAEQSSFGYWGSPTAYGAHWSGTAWHVIALAALGADPEDPRVERGAETLLEEVQPRSGGFATAKRNQPSPCFTAEVCSALARLGFGHHPRVREAIAWLVAQAAAENGWECEDEGHSLDHCCPVASVAALRLVGELPVHERAGLATLAQRAAAPLLARGLFLDGQAPRGWQLLGHPNLSRTDLADALYALAMVRWPSEATIKRALLALLARQDSEGRWQQQHKGPWGEPIGQPSRWVTLKALVATAAYGGSLGAG